MLANRTDFEKEVKKYCPNASFDIANNGKYVDEPVQMAWTAYTLYMYMIVDIIQEYNP